MFVHEINKEKVQVTVNGYEKTVYSKELAQGIIDDTIEFDTLSRIKVAKLFNIDLDKVTQDLKKKDSLLEFSKELEEIMNNRSN